VGVGVDREEAAGRARQAHIGVFEVEACGGGVDLQGRARARRRREYCTRVTRSDPFLTR